MATTETESGQDTISSKIAPWASGEHLRHVETEVIIPKILREKAKAKCDDLVQCKQSSFSNTNSSEFFIGYIITRVW